MRKNKTSCPLSQRNNYPTCIAELRKLACSYSQARNCCLTAASAKDKPSKLLIPMTEVFRLSLSLAFLHQLHSTLVLPSCTNGRSIQRGCVLSSRLALSKLFNFRVNHTTAGNLPSCERNYQFDLFLQSNYCGVIMIYQRFRPDLDEYNERHIIIVSQIPICIYNIKKQSKSYCMKTSTI